MANIKVVELIEGECKQISFTIKDDSGNLVDVSQAVFNLFGKTSLGVSTKLFEKDDGDFDHSNGVNGIVSVVLNSNDLNFSGDAYCVLTTTIESGVDMDKFIFKINCQES
jgi:hypothetical protein